MSKKTDPLSRWSVRDAAELYAIPHWGAGYFDVNDAGNVTASPSDGSESRVDMKELVDDLTGRGIELPILLRFSDILASRVRRLNTAFQNAITEYEYEGTYRGVYPIKVNQSRTVVEELIEFGRPYHYGFEAGSKPELLAVMALHEDPKALIICNGYKDREYIETALLASKLGRTVVLVIEKPSELASIHTVATELNMKPTIGVRAKLTSRGSGRWQQSGGDRAKFGLSAAEMLAVVDQLREWDWIDTLRLLHFHLGSQISAIRAIKDALGEAARFYVELRKLGCTSLDFMDVGGGLGIDYDGSRTSFASSRNYSIQEYANDVVYTIGESCDHAGVGHPTIVSESGRAIAAHHSVLVVNVLGVSQFSVKAPPLSLADDADPLLRYMFEIHEDVNQKNLLESYHDAIERKEQVLHSFTLGHLDLIERVLCERLFWDTCRKILDIMRTMERVPEELLSLERILSDTYFCNFSVFQSMPDAWAVDQLFPVAPIHRLHEEPTCRGVLVDITCDSDGKIEQFIDLRGVKKVLELHQQNDEPYYLGMFLVGAYQEVLGDMHNLFGDTNTVHVSIGKDGHYEIDEVIPGETVADVLRYMQYSPDDLLRKLRRKVEVAVRNKTITIPESRTLIERFRAGLGSYTYLA